MRKTLSLSCLLFLCYLYPSRTFAQDEQSAEAATEQQLEALADNDESESEDDSYLQEWQYRRSNRLNLNAATESDLLELHLLNDLQIAAFLNYRNLLGNLISIYELQAIPTWDLATIRKLIPYITTEDTDSFVEKVKKRWRGGEKTFMYRTAGVLETAKGFLQPKDSSASRYLGSPLKLFVRYKYNYKGILQWGVLGEKDAGEQFLKGAQKLGFDFYSFHFFARKMGNIKALALGDFTVNMGQGLIQWQSLSFNKGASVLAVKRQSAILRPYNSAGEYNFHRGAGITIQKGRWEATVFLSLRKRSASVMKDLAGNSYVASLATSGYHRTLTEAAGRNIFGQTSFGGSLQYYSNMWKVGINGIHYRFSMPIQKGDDPYNLYAFRGKALTNFSIDYNYTYKNIHFFGEIAADNKLNTGMVHGMILSLSAIADASMVYRKISPAFQSMYSTAFTESTMPNNETGLFTGLTLRPFSGITIDAYTDVFRFPWLKFQIDAPSFGKEYFVQLTYKPNKQVEVYMRYRNKAKGVNRATVEDITKTVTLLPRQNWRIHASFKVSNTITLRTRSEMTWYDKKGPAHEEGFSSLVDVFYKPTGKPYSGNFRLQYFDTDGFNSRIYAYENDVLYGASIPALSDKGIRYYVNAKLDPARVIKRFLHLKIDMDIYLRWAQTIYDGKEAVGSSLDEIEGKQKSDFKCQFMFHL